MHYLDQWKAIATRIHGLVEAGKLHVSWLQVRNDDTFGVKRHLRAQAKSIYLAISAFLESQGDLLPKAASEAFKRLDRNIFDPPQSSSDTPQYGQEMAVASILLLNALEVEITYLLSGTQEHVRAKAEQAIAHIQRSIMVDTRIRAEWQAALNYGEVRCENLGAVHLLSHGIYAFKTDAAGGRTDLLFQEPVDASIPAVVYADGLVLTEWKVATKKDLTDKLAQAKTQVDLYAGGVLGGAELAGYRYIVVVSESELAMPADVVVGSIAYRYRNIVTNPKTPSKVCPAG